MKRKNTKRNKQNKKSRRKEDDGPWENGKGRTEEMATTGPALWLLASQHCWLWLRWVCLYVCLVGHCPLLLMPWAHLVTSAPPSSFLTSVYLCVKTDEGWICFFRLRTVVSCTHLEKSFLFLALFFFKAVETLCFKESRLTEVCAVLPHSWQRWEEQFWRMPYPLPPGMGLHVGSRSKKFWNTSFLSSASSAWGKPPAHPRSQSSCSSSMSKGCVSRMRLKCVTLGVHGPECFSVFPSIFLLRLFIFNALKAFSLQFFSNVPVLLVKMPLLLSNASPAELWLALVF